MSNCEIVWFVALSVTCRHQKRLIVVRRKLTLDKALLITQSLERIENNTQTLKGTEPQSVNSLRGQHSHKNQFSRRKAKSHQNPKAESIITAEGQIIWHPVAVLPVMFVPKEGGFGNSVLLKGCCWEAEDIRCQHEGTSIDLSRS